MIVPRVKVAALVAGLALLIGLVLWLAGALGRSERVTRPEIIGPVDTLPDAAALHQRPETTTTVPQRIVKRTVKGHVAVTAGTPDTAGVRRYAAAVREADAYRDTLEQLRARGDTTPPPPAPPRLLPPTWGKYDGKLLRLGVTRSDGSLLLWSATVAPRFDWYTGLDRGSDTLPVIRGDRLWIRVLRQTAKCAPRAAATGGLGALVNTEDRAKGALIAGAAALLGCLTG